MNGVAGGRAQRSGLEDAETPAAAAADAAQAWEEADAAADLATWRAMVKRAFSRLTICPGEPARRRLLRPVRLDGHILTTGTQPA